MGILYCFNVKHVLTIKKTIEDSLTVPDFKMSKRSIGQEDVRNFLLQPNKYFVLTCLV